MFCFCISVLALWWLRQPVKVFTSYTKCSGPILLANLPNRTNRSNTICQAISKGCLSFNLNSLGSSRNLHVSEMAVLHSLVTLLFNVLCKFCNQLFTVSKLAAPIDYRTFISFVNTIWCYIGKCFSNSTINNWFSVLIISACFGF